MFHRFKKLAGVQVNAWDCLTLFGAVLGMLTLISVLGDLWWLFELTTHFPLQYGVILGAVSLSLAGGRRFKTAALFGALAVFNFSRISSRYLPQENPSGMFAGKLRVMEINVETSNIRYDLVKNLVLKEAADLVLFLEVNARWVKELKELRSLYPHAVIEWREDNFGMALFSKRPLARSETLYLGEAEVPSIWVELKTDGGLFRLLGTHPVPPGGAEDTRLRNDQLGQIATLLHNTKEPIILIGDLNTTPWSPQFQRLLKKAKLVDGGRGQGYLGTWPTDYWPMRIPLDHCLVSPGLKVINQRMGPKVGSDHFPLIVDLSYKKSNP